MVRGNTAQWRAYMAPDFHPRQQDTTSSQRWLLDHGDRYAVVGQAT
ncbi:MAG: hypothetical protein K9K38_11380 [Rhodoferax sp.]|nr:hypothetical protein [Rhodoferax sp.]MCF8209990.1 hypothetical protein [Rhodoferax sp.]